MKLTHKLATAAVILSVTGAVHANDLKDFVSNTVTQLTTHADATKTDLFTASGVVNIATSYKPPTVTPTSNTATADEAKAGAQLLRLRVAKATNTVYCANAADVGMNGLQADMKVASGTSADKPLTSTQCSAPDNDFDIKIFGKTETTAGHYDVTVPVTAYSW